MSILKCFCEIYITFFWITVFVYCMMIRLLYKPEYAVLYKQNSYHKKSFSLSCGEKHVPLKKWDSN